MIQETDLPISIQTPTYRTGIDRYLALGIRSEDGGVGVGGDVIVGWINSRTGKGGVDDYFLASEEEEEEAFKCDDDAESCPDSSKTVSKFEI